LPNEEIAATRSGSTKNQSHAPLSRQSLTDLNGLLFLESTAHARGGWAHLAKAPS
jgi:hypothetical protein